MPAGLTPGAPGPLQADYRIEVRDRSGQPNPYCRFVEGVITATYGRVLDGESTASLTVAVPDENEGCADCRPRPWDDLLVFYRADNPEPVWRGPIVEWSHSGSTLSIVAADGMADLGDRRATVNHPALVAGRTPTVHPLDLFEWLIEQGNDRSALPLFVMPPYRPLGIPLVTGEVAAGDEIRAALDALAQDWVDWTVAGPRLYYGAPTILLPELPALHTATSWLSEDVTLTHDGVAIASEVEVVAAGGIVARYPPTPSGAVYRPVRLVRENLTSGAQALQLAKDVWADAQVAQVLITTSGSLAPDCPIAPDDLIPGRLVTVGHQHGSNHALYQQRLAGMSVSIGAVADGDGWALAELSVEVELQPAKQRVTGE